MRACVRVTVSGRYREPRQPRGQPNSPSGTRIALAACTYAPTRTHSPRKGPGPMTIPQDRWVHPAAIRAIAVYVAGMLVILAAWAAAS